MRGEKMEEEKLKNSFVSEVENFADEFERAILSNHELKEFVVNYIDLFTEEAYGLFSYETFRDILLALLIKNVKIDKNKLIDKAFQKAYEFAIKGYKGNFLHVAWCTAEIITIAKVLNVLE